MAGEAPAAASPPLDDGWSSDSFAQDPVILLLEDVEERRKVVLLRKSLDESPLETDEEDGRGLYDDALCLIRYLRARKWDLQKAEAMIRNTGRWRKTINFRGIREGAFYDNISELNAQGPMYVRGFALKGSPLLYAFPRNNRSSNYEAMVHHVVYNLERAIACFERQRKEGTLQLSPVDPKAGKIVMLMAFADLSFQHLLPVSVLVELLHILQDHYPERLAHAFIFDAPWVINTFLNTIRPMMDPVTQEKFQVVTEWGEERTERMSKMIDPAQLELEVGGSIDRAPFDSSIYLGTKISNTEFGLEYNEQLCLAEANLQSTPSSSKLAGPRAFWKVSSDRRTLSLTKKQRSLVRELSIALCRSVEPSREDHEGLYDDAGALIRYLTSQAWSLSKAEGKIRATGRWRKDFGLSALRRGAYAEALARESAFGKMYVRGFDRAGRPIIYVKLHSPDSGSREDTLTYFVYCLERAVACIEHRRLFKRQQFVNDNPASGVQQPADKFTVIVDFTGYSRHNRPALKTLRAAMAILQDHYPERLEQAFLMWPPLKITAFMMVVRRLVDRALYQKFVVVKDAQFHVQLLSTVFEIATLERWAGGETESTFDSTVFLSKEVDGDVYGSEFNAQLRSL